MVATADGQMIRMKVKDISVMGRNTQGVRLFSTDGAKVRLVTRLATNVLGSEDDTAAGDEPTVVAESDGVVAVVEKTANEDRQQ
jgi:DNA gyrase subunit A